MKDEPAWSYLWDAGDDRVYVGGRTSEEQAEGLMQAAADSCRECSRPTPPNGEPCCWCDCESPHGGSDGR